MAGTDRRTSVTAYFLHDQKLKIELLADMQSLSVSAYTVRLVEDAWRTTWGEVAPEHIEAQQERLVRNRATRRVDGRRVRR